jgi:hypothetical protein
MLGLWKAIPRDKLSDRAECAQGHAARTYVVFDSSLTRGGSQTRTAIDYTTAPLLDLAPPEDTT